MDSHSICHPGLQRGGQPRTVPQPRPPRCLRNLGLQTNPASFHSSSAKSTGVHLGCFSLAPGHLCMGWEVNHGPGGRPLIYDLDPAGSQVLRQWVGDSTRSPGEGWLSVLTLSPTYQLCDSSQGTHSSDHLSRKETPQPCAHIIPWWAGSLMSPL